MRMNVGFHRPLRYNGRRQWHPTPVLSPGKSHGWRRLEGCSPWGHWGSDTTERLHFHFSLSCIGEGNGNPLQCSCLENPRDGGAWWAAIYGVAQSRTRLKRLSSSSSSFSKSFSFVSGFRFSMHFHVNSSLLIWWCFMGLLSVKVKSLSRVRLLATPWTVACQAPLSMGFSRQ